MYQLWIWETTGSRPPGLGGHQSGGIIPANHNLCTFFVFREQPGNPRAYYGLSSIFRIQTPTTVDKRWVNCTGLFSTSKISFGIIGKNKPARLPLGVDQHLPSPLQNHRNSCYWINDYTVLHTAWPLWLHQWWWYLPSCFSFSLKFSGPNNSRTFQSSVFGNWTRHFLLMVSNQVCLFRFVL